MEDSPSTADSPTEATEAAPAPEDTTPASEAVETFSADYVRELRKEAAESRVKAKLTDAANDRLLASYAVADGRLMDPELITVTPDLIGEDGLVDAGKVTAAIDSLLQAKPIYAKAKAPVVPQGVREDAPAERGLFALMRERL